MILEIAIGIVLAVLILKNLDAILALGILVSAGAIVLLLLVIGLYFIGPHFEEILELLLKGTVFLFVASAAGAIYCRLPIIRRRYPDLQPISRQEIDKNFLQQLSRLFMAYFPVGFRLSLFAGVIWVASYVMTIESYRSLGIALLILIVAISLLTMVGIVTTRIPWAKDYFLNPKSLTRAQSSPVSIFTHIMDICQYYVGIGLVISFVIAVFLAVFYLSIAVLLKYV